MKFSHQAIPAWMGLSCLLAKGESAHVLAIPHDFVSCLNKKSLKFHLEGSCSYDLFREQVEVRMLQHLSCKKNDADMEIMAVLNTPSIQDAKAKFDEMCRDTIKDIMERRPTFDFNRFSNMDRNFNKAFFDGGSSWIDGGVPAHKANIPQNSNTMTSSNFKGKSDRIHSIYQNVAKRRPMSWPDNLDNFHDCAANAAMCCWVKHDSTQDARYHRNTDICYVDYSRAPSSSHMDSGIGLFGGMQGAYCHGFAWEDGSIDDLLKGNLLFASEIVENMKVRGLSKNVPGEYIFELSFDSSDIVSGFLMMMTSNLVNHLQVRQCVGASSR